MQIVEYRRMDCHIIYIALFGILSCDFNLSVFFCCVFMNCFIFSCLMMGIGSMKCMCVTVHLYNKHLNNYTT
jgi:hypothetical protein